MPSIKGIHNLCQQYYIAKPSGSDYEACSKPAYYEHGLNQLLGEAGQEGWVIMKLRTHHSEKMYKWDPLYGTWVSVN